MVKKVKRHIEEVQDIIVGMLCNKCGKDMWKMPSVTDWLSIEKTWGYGTPHDCETHKLDICSSCYTKFIKSFKIPIDKS